MNRVAIERIESASIAEFGKAMGAATRPVVITNATQSWAARSKWTFEYLKAAYGSDFVSAPLGLMSDVTKLTKLGAFIDYVERPEAGLKGFWVNRKDGRPLREEPASQQLPHYLFSWRGFQRLPELYDDIFPPPGFIEDWQLALTAEVREAFEAACGREYFSIFIGPEGALSRLHQDFWQTHAYLAQIKGRKKCFLFPPGDRECLYAGQVDPEAPDLERFKNFAHATMHECVIEPGDLLYIPPNWWHQVRSLEKSITVSHNFFNASNFSAHLEGIFRNVPRLVEGIESSSSLKENLRIDWRSRGFLDPET